MKDANAELASDAVGLPPVIDAPVAEPPTLAPSPSGQVLTVTSNGETLDGQESFDTLNDPSFSNNTIFSFQESDSHTDINLGTGTSNTVVAHTFDTITASLGTDTFEEFNGHNNTYLLGGGNFTVNLSNNDTVVAGNGNNQIQFYSGASNDTITLGNGNNNVNDGEGAGTFSVSGGTGIDVYEFFGMSSGSLTVAQALGARPDVIDITNSTLSSLTATITNASDVIVDSGSSVASYQLNVAVDGYKAPYDATVTYVATSEAIAAPYNVAQPLPYFIADLLFDPVPRWTAALGVQATAPVLSFSFMQALPSYASTQDANGFQTLGPDLPSGETPQQLLAANTAHTISLTAAEVSAITALLDWSTVANVDFVSAADSNSVTIRFGGNIQSDDSGYAYDPLDPIAPYYPASDYDESGDVYLNEADVNTSGYFAAGGYGNEVFLHEIGHTLGLGGESGASDPHDVLPDGEDTIANTVMSHNVGTGPYAGTLEVYDIAVAQYLYGPNPNYHPNASHVWSFNASGGAVNLISDGGGFTNTITAAGTTTNAFIDLRQLHWSYLGTQAASILAPDQLMINEGTVVDDAIAGNGTDTIVCNDDNDAITCGSGSDTIVVGPGHDTVTGGSGTDTVVFAAASSAYSIGLSAGVVTVVGSGAGSAVGTDTLTNVADLQFTDETISTASLSTSVGTGIDFLGDGGADEFFRLSTGQLTVNEVNASGAVLGTASFTVGGTPLAIDEATTIIGAGEDYAGSGDRDLFYRNAQGQLFGWQFNGNEALVSNLFFTAGGAPLAIDGATTIIGAGEDYAGGGDRDLFYQNASGQLFGWQFNASGALASNLFFTVGGAPLAIRDGTTVIGAGEDFAGSGDTDLFYQNASGQLFGWQFNASGALVSNLFFTVGGAPVPITDGTTIIGAGEDFAGTGDRDLFYQNASGQLFGWQFNAGGALASNLFYTVGGAALAISDGTTIIGAGEDYAGSGDHDLFYRNPAGQLFGWQFNAGGALISNLFFTVGGAPLPIGDGNTVIGAGEDYAGTGDLDIFYRNPEDQLFGWQFNASGALVSNLFFTQGGAPLPINGGTSIIGAGEDYAGTGDRDVFYRNSLGQLYGWQFNASGVFDSNLIFTVGGAPLPIGGGMAIIGAGEDYAGSGDRDLFYRNASGQLFGWQFNASGALASNLFFTAGGAPIGINDATTIIGAGEDYAGSGDDDVFYRNAAGQLFGWQFNASGALVSNLFFTQSGAPLAIASGSEILGAGRNVLGSGGYDLFARNSSDQLSVLEFNGAGSLTGSETFPALGNGDSAQLRVGTTGSDTLTGPAGVSTLIGDGGTDTYVFGSGATNELIVNGVSGSATSGTLAFTTSATDINLWLDRVVDNGNVSSSGNNLRIDVLGTTTGVIIDDWFAAGTPNGPLSAITAGGLTLDTQVSNLVSAMATFEAGNPSFNPTTAGPAITDSTVLTAVNADWHH